jgi:hypothetical protein
LLNLDLESTMTKQKWIRVIEDDSHAQIWSGK